MWGKGSLIVTNPQVDLKASQNSSSHQLHVQHLKKKKRRRTNCIQTAQHQTTDRQVDNRLVNRAQSLTTPHECSLSVGCANSYLTR